MPNADFNKEFPTRASLRRARQAELAIQEKAKDEAKKNSETPQGADEFDAVPESGATGSPTPASSGDAKGKQAEDRAAQGAGAKPAASSGSAKHAPRNNAASSEDSVKPQGKPAPDAQGVLKPTSAKENAAPSKDAAPKSVNAPAAAATAATPTPGPKVEAKPAAPKASDSKPAPAKGQAPTAANAPKPAAPATSSAKPVAPAAKPGSTAAPAKTDNAVPAPKPAASKPAPATKPAATTKPSEPKVKPADTPGTKQTAAPAKPAAPAPGKPVAKPAPVADSKKPAEPKAVANPTVATKPAPVADSKKPAEPKAVASEAVTAKPTPPKDPAKPTGAKPAANATAPAPEPTKKASDGAAAEDLSTPEGRRQAFREMNPATGTRDTFLRPEEETAVRAERGFRGFLARLGFNMKPSVEEVEERKWRRTVGTRLSEPKTISVVNGKGGANKTPTAVLLSAVFGRDTGDPVLVWDNNGTRGTLGWRTVQGPHSAHSMDLLEAAPRLKDVKVGDPVIHEYTHYQPEDCYSVLRTDPTLLASEQFVNAADFDELHGIVSRFFALTIVDSGNDESAERWMRMIDHTDQLVIASTTVEEHAEAGALLLEALAKRGGHYAELAKNSVVIVSQHQPHGNNEQLERIAQGFGRLARSVVTVPYDAALVKGQIRFEALRPATRRAWLHATAAVAGALHG
ncbi:MinD/ParA family ATP-binding protein [Paeniglutamicibacter antarcticus]|uniref:MinD-like ATPase involved in chromosome partitioning or flagellar assembly n=1 Tax=Paeniglutamicibacter antarcticus TaxID=494023 RepID=A0ABP9TQ87_9MICC